MERSRRIEIERHLSEEEIDDALRDAEDEHRLRRIGFLKNLYRGDSIPEAAEREGRSATTGVRWARAWNEGGLEAMMPDFGGGRPPKLDEDERAELLELLRAGQPWNPTEVRRLIEAEFDVEYHPEYLGEFLRNLGLTYAKPRPERPNRTGGAGGPDEESPGERESDGGGGWVVDDDRTDSSTSHDR